MITAEKQQGEKHVAHIFLSVFFFFFLAVQDRPLRCHWRHDLDESAGEVVELLVVSDEVDRRRALHAGEQGTASFEGRRFAPFQQQPNLIMRVRAFPVFFLFFLLLLFFSCTRAGLRAHAPTGVLAAAGS